MSQDQAARIAASIDWTPTCLPGQERQTIVRQILDAATYPAASGDPDDARTPAWVRVLRAKTGLALTPDPWGHWCCQAGAMANPGPCPWHPAASEDTIERAARVLAQVDEDWLKQRGAAAYATWEELSERSRDSYRTDARRLAAAGLLADGQDRARIEKALAVCDAGEHQATRWEQPFPVPAWVTDVRAALTSPEEQK
jgi:hypothetical protein